jgi:opacity protein-like surface antigen
MTLATRRTPLAAAALLAGLFTLCAPSEAAAQFFINPFIGYNFGGDSGCPEVLNCEDKALNLGVSIGALGGIVGTEFDMNFIDQFFGETATTSTKVSTYFGNFLLAPKFGPVQPYGLIGLGLIRTDVQSTGLTEGEDRNDFGWDVGGGLMIFFGQHVGVRGDLRYMHSVDALELIGLQSDNKLDFGRATGGVVFKF